ncbi:phosphoribosyltransferase [Natronobeatus ordinarius]|uniref:phosphoribosyltransferase n=1 Tax=Natronobeatus ordinarius TaxID=2963433 RepID=UPI0020CF5834|nr:phosphoribosyltransferase family protein [Natronobeatus ordinarius]
MFDDRTDAGERLAADLSRRGVDADVVLGIPRGALPVARPVADELEAELDVVVASKIGAPTNPELAIGAVASDGSVWRNEGLVARLGVSEGYVEQEREREATYAREKADRYRDDGIVPDLEGKRVVVVDDGVATGATARACLRQVTEAGADHVVLAVPVGSPDSLEEIASEVDEVVALERPPHFGAVGQFYRQFGQVSDEEAITYLDDRP